MPSWYGGEFDAICRRLRREFITSESVAVLTANKGSVRSDDNERCSGISFPEPNGSWKIIIERGLNRDLAIDTLLHEYAHVLDREKNGEPSKDHRDSWGKIYARLYHAIIES